MQRSDEAGGPLRRGGRTGRAVLAAGGVHLRHTSRVSRVTNLRRARLWLYMLSFTNFGNWFHGTQHSTAELLYARNYGSAH